MHVSIVGTDLKAYSKHVPFKYMSALKHSGWSIQIHTYTRTPTPTHAYSCTFTNYSSRKEQILLLSSRVFPLFPSPFLLSTFLYLFAVFSHCFSILFGGINAGFECDEMQICLMEGQLMKLELKLANGWKGKMKPTSEWACKDSKPRVQSVGDGKEHLKRFDLMHRLNLHLSLAYALHTGSRSHFSFYCLEDTVHIHKHSHPHAWASWSDKQMGGVIFLTREKKSQFTPLIFPCLPKGDNPPTEWQPSYEMQIRTRGLMSEERQRATLSVKCIFGSKIVVVQMCSSSHVQIA